MMNIIIILGPKVAGMMNIILGPKVTKMLTEPELASNGDILPLGNRKYSVPVGKAIEGHKTLTMLRPYRVGQATECEWGPLAQTRVGPATEEGHRHRLCSALTWPSYG